MAPVDAERRQPLCLIVVVFPVWEKSMSVPERNWFLFLFKLNRRSSYRERSPFYYHPFFSLNSEKPILLVSFNFKTIKLNNSIVLDRTEFQLGYNQKENLFLSKYILTFTYNMLNAYISIHLNIIIIFYWNRIKSNKENTT